MTTRKKYISCSVCTASAQTEWQIDGYPHSIFVCGDTECMDATHDRIKQIEKAIKGSVEDD